MRRVVRYVSWVLVFVAAGAAIASWTTTRGELDATDAGEIAVDALGSVGHPGTVVGTPQRDEHSPPGEDPVDVWVVSVEVGDEQIEMRVQTTVGAVVFVDDRIGEGDLERLLTDEEFAELGAYRDRRLRDRRIRTNLAGSLAAAAVAAVGVPLSFRSASLWRQDPS